MMMMMIMLLEMIDEAVAVAVGCRRPKKKVMAIDDGKMYDPGS